MATNRGAGIARYNGDEAIYPSELRFSGEGELIPIRLHYDVPAYKKGGLVKDALAVRRAGRYGDTELVHVNKEELEELRELWGEPTINPETGLPEYFLKKVWKGIKKIAKPIAPLLPIAASFIPGVGPLAAAAIGAGSGLLSGRGLKGALLGGVTGAIGAGALGGAGKAAGEAAGQAASTGAQAASTGAQAASTGAQAATQAAGQGAGTLEKIASTLPTVAGGMPGPSAAPPMQELPPIQPTLAPAGGPPPPMAAQPAPSALPTVQQPGQRPNFWNRDFLGIKGLPNKYGVPLGMLAAYALSRGGGGGGDPLGMGQWKKHAAYNFDDDSMPAPGANFYARGGEVQEPSDWAVQRFPYAFDGEEAEPRNPVFRAKGGSYAVKGEGTGRSDHIPAYLSDGEYVMDAETVALLGDGSSKAGAEKLDSFRVQLRKHKGAKLAKGKFSGNAKDPMHYLGGRA